MEMEADIFMVFTGWSPKDTAEMSFDDLHHWHQLAIKRHNASQQG
ncbi:putative tail protein [Aeromonas phage Ahp2]|nr:putative tail protein [Aeromonas phage Ahp2]